ncbi:hypothetical protein [Caldimonas tepidiphila]|uniref:hypothetical protein n=1 Tax=Caldimonas tepidiphila TaxID=2315841 RepID=UPI000E5ADBEE|nr:hypothetical protein [Caldimonas tepidiphila]
MIYIENEGALFRGPARGVPREVWSPKDGRFVPYMDSAPKPIDWGNEISEDEAREMMSGGACSWGPVSPSSARR